MLEWCLSKVERIVCGLSKSTSGFLGFKMLKLQISALSLKYYFVLKSGQNNETRVRDGWKCSRNQWVIVEIISVVQANNIST